MKTKKLLYPLIYFFLPLTLFSFNAQSKPKKFSSQTRSVRKKNSSKRNKSIKVFVFSKSAIVHGRPNFDSEVIAKFSKGSKILGAVKKTAGTDGFGLFHKVRLKKGVYGYVIDTSFAGFKADGLFNKPQKTKRKGFFSKRARSEKSRSSKAPRSIGLSYALSNYKLKTSNQELKTRASFYGLKYTGLWNNKFPIDVSLMYSSNASDLFKSVAFESSGFVLLMDLTTFFTLYKAKSYMAYLNLGGLASYYSFNFNLIGDTQARESSKTSIGYVAGLGVAFNINSFILRTEARYFKDHDSQLMAILSLQRFF